MKKSAPGGSVFLCPVLVKNLRSKLYTLKNRLFGQCLPHQIGEFITKDLGAALHCTTGKASGDTAMVNESDRRNTDTHNFRQFFLCDGELFAKLGQISTVIDIWWEILIIHNRLLEPI